eukprot:9136-Heterococcus_DN1.PRE.6
MQRHASIAAYVTSPQERHLKALAARCYTTACSEERRYCHLTVRATVVQSLPSTQQSNSATTTQQTSISLCLLAHIAVV